MLNYIDVRGPNPIYFCGHLAYILQNAPRNITIADARRILRLAE